MYIDFTKHLSMFCVCRTLQVPFYHANQNQALQGGIINSHLIVHSSSELSCLLIIVGETGYVIDGATETSLFSHFPCCGIYLRHMVFVCPDRPFG